MKATKRVIRSVLIGFELAAFRLESCLTTTNLGVVVHCFGVSKSKYEGGRKCVCRLKLFDHFSSIYNQIFHVVGSYVSFPVLVSPPQASETDKIRQLFKQGVCYPGSYEFQGRCYVLSRQSETRIRSNVYLHDDASGGCLLAMHAVGFDCSSRPNAWGTSSCPVAATPHTAVDAAFLRLLLNVFGMGSTSAWIGLKLRSNNGTVSCRHIILMTNSFPLNFITTLLCLSGLPHVTSLLFFHLSIVEFANIRTKDSACLDTIR